MELDDSIHYGNYLDSNTSLTQISAKLPHMQTDVLSVDEARQAYLEYAGEHADVSVVRELGKCTKQVVKPPEE